MEGSGPVAGSDAHVPCEDEEDGDESGGETSDLDLPGEAARVKRARDSSPQRRSDDPDYGGSGVPALKRQCHDATDKIVGPRPIHLRHMIKKINYYYIIIN